MQPVYILTLLGCFFTRNVVVLRVTESSRNRINIVDLLEDSLGSKSGQTKPLLEAQNDFIRTGYKWVRKQVANDHNSKHFGNWGKKKLLKSQAFNFDIRKRGRGKENGRLYDNYFKTSAQNSMARLQYHETRDTIGGNNLFKVTGENEQARKGHHLLSEPLKQIHHIYKQKLEDGDWMAHKHRLPLSRSSKDPISFWLLKLHHKGRHPLRKLRSYPISRICCKAYKRKARFPLRIWDNLLQKRPFKKRRRHKSLAYGYGLSYLSFWRSENHKLFRRNRKRRPSGKGHGSTRQLVKTLHGKSMAKRRKLRNRRKSIIYRKGKKRDRMITAKTQRGSSKPVNRESSVDGTIKHYLPVEAPRGYRGTTGTQIEMSPKTGSVEDKVISQPNQRLKPRGKMDGMKYIMKKKAHRGKETHAVLDEIVLINKKSDKDLPEGDLRLTKGQLNESLHQMRDAIKDRNHLWTSRKIYYEFDTKLSDKAKETINAAITQYHYDTCIRFVPFNASLGNATKRLYFYQGDGCWSFIGKTDFLGKQDISIGEGCEVKSIVMHELMHAIGFFHEQSRNDRDTYIEILWENIIKGEEGNFVKHSREQITGIKTPYDYDGLMHYGRRAFSKNGKQTIRALNYKGQSLGQTNGFSATDLMEIKRLYGCNDKGTGWSPWSSFSPCSDKCYKERQRICFQKDYKLCKGSGSSRVLEDVRRCTDKECKRDGHWGHWSPWSVCSATCHYGTHKRQRTCVNPPPRHGGKFCAGPNQQVKKCYNGPCNLGSLDCTFENGTCIWSVSPNHHPWLRRQFGTFTINTGPSGDHTLMGEGYYIYFEASELTYGDQGILESRSIVPQKLSCFQFWYNMYGSGMGSLLVQMQTSKSTKTIATISGNQGAGWKHFQKEISSDTQFKITFKAIRGKTPQSDIAVDDIFIRKGHCPNVSALTTSSATVTIAPSKTSFISSSFSSHPTLQSKGGMTVSKHLSFTPGSSLSLSPLKSSFSLSSSTPLNQSTSTGAGRGGRTRENAACCIKLNFLVIPLCWAVLHTVLEVVK